MSDDDGESGGETAGEGASKDERQAADAGETAAKAERPKRPSWFLAHIAVNALLALYFVALLLWFGRLFLTGGTEEHVVMSIVIPVVLLVGSVSLVTFVTIALEGRRHDLRAAEAPTASGHSAHP